MKIDNAEKILFLTLIIKNICEENNLPKQMVIDDFIDLINQNPDEKIGE